MLRIFKGEGKQIKTRLQFRGLVGKAEPCTLTLGTETSAASMESVWKILKDDQVEMLHNPALPPSGMYRSVEALAHRIMLFVTLFPTPKV